MRKEAGLSDPKIAGKLVREIHAKAKSLGPTNLMEVCGTHTAAICRAGIHCLLPKNIRTISGPGCPVCVTPSGYIDAAIQIGRGPDVIITTFGDMIRVPGSVGSLESVRAEGADVRVVLSATESLNLARENHTKKVVFLAVGFETTVPSIAVLIEEAAKAEYDNVFILSAHKLIPPAMSALLESGDCKIDGFICPGHVSTIIGAEAYDPIAEKYKIPCVISGFEPVDILISIDILLKRLLEGKSRVDNEYARAVGRRGNRIAQRKIAEVFDVTDTVWRGIGTIPKSGLRLKDTYARFDAEKVFGLDTSGDSSPPGCLCGSVIKGVNVPTDCAFFGKRCTPTRPVGPCMVSSEGSCAAYYKYGG